MYISCIYIPVSIYDSILNRKAFFKSSPKKNGGVKKKNHQLQGRGAKTTTAAKMQKLCTKGKGDVAPMAKDPQVVNVVTILGGEL